MKLIKKEEEEVKEQYNNKKHLFQKIKMEQKCQNMKK